MKGAARARPGEISPGRSIPRSAKASSVSAASTATDESAAQRQTNPGIAQSLREYARGLAGGLIFSLPLLYTAEVWWAGFVLSPWQLLLALPFTFVLLCGYNRFAGMRADANWLEVAIDSVEELGLGIVVSTIALLLLGRIRLDMPFVQATGVVAVEAIIVAIGVSVGTAQLGASDDDEHGMVGEDDDQPPRFGEQIVLAVCGALLFALNVAPTQEIQIIAIDTGAWRLIGLMALSLVLNSLVLFFSDFRGAQQFARSDNLVAVLVGSIITYTLALAVSALTLWFFGRFDGMGVSICMAQTIVLGVAATLGASAGRLLIQ